MNTKIDCSDPECFDPDHTHQTLGDMMREQADKEYYATRTEKILVPVEVVYYENIELIQTYKFPSEEEVEKALKERLMGSFRIGNFDLSTHDGREALKKEIKKTVVYHSLISNMLDKR